MKFIPSHLPTVVSTHTKAARRGPGPFPRSTSPPGAASFWSMSATQTAGLVARWGFFMGFFASARSRTIPVVVEASSSTPKPRSLPSATSTSTSTSTSSSTSPLSPATRTTLRALAAPAPHQLHLQARGRLFASALCPRDETVLEVDTTVTTTATTADPPHTSPTLTRVSRVMPVAFQPVPMTFDEPVESLPNPTRPHTLYDSTDDHSRDAPPPPLSPPEAAPSSSSSSSSSSYSSSSPPSPSSPFSSLPRRSSSSSTRSRYRDFDPGLRMHRLGSKRNGGPERHIPSLSDVPLIYELRARLRETHRDPTRVSKLVQTLHRLACTTHLTGKTGSNPTPTPGHRSGSGPTGPTGPRPGRRAVREGKVEKDFADDVPAVRRQDVYSLLAELTIAMGHADSKSCALAARAVHQLQNLHERPSPPPSSPATSPSVSVSRSSSSHLWTSTPPMPSSSPTITITPPGSFLDALRTRLTVLRRSGDLHPRDAFAVLGTGLHSALVEEDEGEEWVRIALALPRDKSTASDLPTARRTRGEATALLHRAGALSYRHHHHHHHLHHHHHRHRHGDRGGSEPNQGSFSSSSSSISSSSLVRSSMMTIPDDALRDAIVTACDVLTEVGCDVHATTALARCLTSTYRHGHLPRVPLEVIQAATQALGMVPGMIPRTSHEEGTQGRTPEAHALLPLPPRVMTELVEFGCRAAATDSTAAWLYLVAVARMTRSALLGESPGDTSIRPSSASAWAGLLGRWGAALHLIRPGSGSGSGSGSRDAEDVAEAVMDVARRLHDTLVISDTDKGMADGLSDDVRCGVAVSESSASASASVSTSASTSETTVGSSSTSNSMPSRPMSLTTARRAIRALHAIRASTSRPFDKRLMTKLQRMEAREEAAAAAVAVVKQQVKHHAEMDLRVGRRRRRFDDERRHAREHDHDHRQGHVVGQETTSTRSECRLDVSGDEVRDPGGGGEQHMDNGDEDLDMVARRLAHLRAMDAGCLPHPSGISRVHHVWVETN